MKLNFVKNQYAKNYRIVFDEKGKLLFPSIFYYEGREIIVRQAIPDYEEDLKSIMKVVEENEVEVTSEDVTECLRETTLDTDFVWLLFDKKGNLLGSGQFEYIYSQDTTRTWVYTMPGCTEENLTEMQEAFEEIKLFSKVVIGNIA